MTSTTSTQPPAPFTFADLLTLINSCTPTPGGQAAPATVSITAHQAILKQLGIIVCGEILGLKTIVAFSTTLGKNVEIKDISKYKLENLLQDFGESVEGHIYSGSDDVPPGMYRMADVRKAIAVEGGKRPIKPGDRLARGIWELSGRLVLVGASQVAIFNGHLEFSRIAEVDGRLLELNAVDPWFSELELEKNIELSKDPQWCRDVLREAIGVFQMWDNLSHPNDPELLAALACCCWLQTIWKWRPLVAVTGKTNSGKTVLLENVIAAMYQTLAIFTQKPTEAGVRQAVGSSASVLVIDEFEKSRHRQEILELLRTSSRGGTVLRGTPGQREQRFGLKHIVWVGSIETGLRDAADKNRFLTIELKTVDLKSPGKKKLVPPDPATVHNLGARLLAVAMRYWRQVMTLAEELNGRVAGEVDHRLAESFGLPVALLGCVWGLTIDQSADLLRSLMQGRTSVQDQESDESRLLRAIYEATVIGERGSRYTVSELLSADTYMGPERDSLLRGVGLKQVKPATGPFDSLFIVQETVCRTLLRETDWQFMQIKQILLRIPGAELSQQRWGAHRSRGVLIPMQSIADLIGGGKSDDIEYGVSTEPSTSIF